jgi:hypothetical protein
MKTRIAKKIVKRHAIRCRRRIDGPEDITTAGGHAYAEGVYQKALRILHRRLDKELTAREPGAIRRMAAINQELNAARLAVLIARSK